MDEHEQALAAEIAAAQIERIDNDILAARERRDQIDPGWPEVGYPVRRPGAFHDACLEVDRLITIRRRISEIGQTPASFAAKIRERSCRL